MAINDTQRVVATPAADVINAMGTRPFLPVGTPLWRESAIGSSSTVRSEPAPVRR